MVYRDGTAYATQGGLVRVAGYKKSGAFTSSATIADTTAAGAVTQEVGKLTYDIGGSASCSDVGISIADRLAAKLKER